MRNYRSVPIRLLAVTSAAVMAVVFAAQPASASTSRGEHLGVRVYVLDFDPLIDGQTPLTSFAGWNDPGLLDEQYRLDVSAASGGVVDQRIVLTSVVRSYPIKSNDFTFTNSQYLGCLANSGPAYCSNLIDYAAVLNTTYDPSVGSACDAIHRGRVDEIWLWGGPWFGYLEYVSVAARTSCSKVSRPFVVMGFSYERGIGEMLHNLGHRSESLIQAGVGLALWDQFDGQRDRYGQDYACPAEPDAGHPEVDPVAHAGNVHFPPNGYCHYQYDRDHSVLSDADDWANFPNLTGQQTAVNADTWGGTQRGFLIWWLGRFPRRPGSIQTVEYDWWRYVFPTWRHHVPA